MTVVTALSHPEISEASVIIDGASTGVRVTCGPRRRRRSSAGPRVTRWPSTSWSRVMTPVLWHVVRAYRLSTEVAEDVVQTTWLALVRSRDRIEEPAAVGGWLTTTARREAWRVGQGQRPGAAHRGRRAGPRAAGPGLRRGGRRTAATATTGCGTAVDRLGERCRRLLRIVAFEHRPDYSKIAADLGMPIGSIGPTRSRCLARSCGP